jgi:hypothetical protein
MKTENAETTAAVTLTNVVWPKEKSMSDGTVAVTSDEMTTNTDRLMATAARKLKNRMSFMTQLALGWSM